MNTGSQKKNLKRKIRRTLYRTLTALDRIDFSRYRSIVLLVILAGMALSLSKLPTTQTAVTSPVAKTGSTIAANIRSVISESDPAHPADIVVLFLPADSTEESQFLTEGASETLYSFYLTGEEVFYLTEGVTTITSKDSVTYLDGLSYTYHKNRLPFGKVVELTLQNGQVPNANAMYHVISTEDIFALFHYLSYRSLGIMEIAPKAADGSYLADYHEVLPTEHGTVLTIADVLAPSKATTALQTSVIRLEGYNLIDLVRSPNKMSLCAFALLFSLCALIWYIIPRLRRIRLWFRIYRIRSKKRCAHSLYFKKRFRNFRRI